MVGNFKLYLWSVKIFWQEPRSYVLVWPARGQAEEKKYFRSVKIFLLSRSGCCLVWPEHWGQSEEQPSVGCCPRPYRQAWYCLVYGGWWHHPSITAAAIRSLGRVWYRQLSHTAVCGHQGTASEAIKPSYHYEYCPLGYRLEPLQNSAALLCCKLALNYIQYTLIYTLRHPTTQPTCRGAFC